MAENCTCGTRLVEDAVFCHKCGKPVRPIEVDSEPLSTGAIPVAAVPAEAPPPVNFHNPIAVRVAFWVALLAMLLTSYHPVLTVIVWCAAGYFAVFLYRRLTGLTLDVRAGIHLGWITGVIMFAMMTVLFTVELLAASSEGGIAAAFREPLMKSADPRTKLVLQMLDTPSGLGTLLMALLVMMFVSITLFSVAGGAIGAKLAGGRSEAP